CARCCQPKRTRWRVRSCGRRRRRQRAYGRSQPREATGPGSDRTAPRRAVVLEPLQPGCLLCTLHPAAFRSFGERSAGLRGGAHMSCTWRRAALALSVLLITTATVGCGTEQVTQRVVGPEWQEATSASGNYVAEFPG